MVPAMRLPACTTIQHNSHWASLAALHRMLRLAAYICSHRWLLTKSPLTRPRSPLETSAQHTTCPAVNVSPERSREMRAVRCPSSSGSWPICRPLLGSRRRDTRPDARSHCTGQGQGGPALLGAQCRQAGRQARPAAWRLAPGQLPSCGRSSSTLQALLSTHPPAPHRQAQARPHSAGWRTSMNAHVGMQGRVLFSQPAMPGGGLAMAAFRASSAARSFTTSGGTSYTAAAHVQEHPLHLGCQCAAAAATGRSCSGLLPALT